MKRTRQAWIATLLLAAMLPAVARGAGYAIYEQGSAVLGMAGAGTASVHDPSALFFNPAKLVTLPGTQVYAGANTITLWNSFAGVAPYPGYGVTEEMTPQTFVPPNVYLTHGWNGRFALGAGFYVPYGLGIEWKDPDRFTGRYIATKADLQGLEANVTAAYALAPNLSIAAGYDALFARVNLRQHVQSVIPGGGGAIADVAKAELDADYTPGYGWNAALWWKPLPSTQVGFSYHSRISVDVDGTVDFTQIPTGNPIFDALVAAQLKDQDVSTTLRFPALWSLGVAWSPTDAWTFEGDFNWTEWSFFTDLPITFKSTPSMSRRIQEDYQDSYQVRIGGEHRRGRAAWRAGYYYDRAAAPTQSVTPLLPDSDRNGVALGLGYALTDHLTVDAYDCALFVRTRSTADMERDNYNGVYHGFVNLGGAALTWRF